jgi:hypothetical protein
LALPEFSLERGTIVRAAIIVVLLALVIFALPSFVGADWITTFTSVAIYSVVSALGSSTGVSG